MFVAAGLSQAIQTDSSRVLAKNSQINGTHSHLDGLSGFTEAADLADAEEESVRTVFNRVPSVKQSAQT